VGTADGETCETEVKAWCCRVVEVGPVATASHLFADVVQLGADAVVLLRGEIDLSTVTDLELALATIPSERTVIVDCAAVDFIDSSGLRVFLQEHQRHHAEGATLAVREPSSMLRRMLTRTGLTMLLEQPGWRRVEEGT
jgi:anti-anti-sigma factor